MRGDAGAPAGPTVAVLDKRGRFLTAEPFFAPGRRLVVDGRRARVGDLVLVEARGGRTNGHAQVKRVIGRPEVARDVLEGLMLDRGLARRFDPSVERAAHDAQPLDAARRDLRELPTFTIDPVSARDFDDAISAQELDGGVRRIWVHIADVAAYVRPGSPVDREAYRRGTSVYVPGAVEPMLPDALSNGACSLVPGQDRLAVTVEMDFVGARVERAAFHRSRIRSDERLDYDRVDRVFAGTERGESPWSEPLAVARAAACALEEARAARGALVVESAEPDFEFDARGNVLSARATAQTESHRLIEHLMIAANEQVARALDESRTPALYRVHERPEPEAVRRLVEQLASLEVPTPPMPAHPSPQQAAELVGEISVQVDAHVRRTGRGRRALTTLVLRALKQAAYHPRNLGHAGLQSPRYCHFTSPIRRYPDLVCHRALLALVGGGEDAPAASGLEQAATWASERERDAMKIERAADDVARCFLLERELFEQGWERDWEGEVIGVIGAGAFVAFGEGHEGLLPVRRMRGDWWELNEEGTTLRGTRSGKVVRLGDPVRVQVERVETARGRVDLLPVEL
ncbi:MAG: ribonuclease [Solirubrobacteraceae bacterium]|nr:ribonuclease [Solirubrobacteraceae bacterium]